MELTIDRLWNLLIENPDRVYFTDVQRKAFQVLIREGYFEVLRLEADYSFVVRQRLTKENLASALQDHPTRLSDISKSVRGPSYCLAIIKAYR